jgi:hypothetical protein
MFPGSLLIVHRYTLAASSSLAWPLVPDCLVKSTSVPVYPYTLAAASSLAWPLIPSGSLILHMHKTAQAKLDTGAVYGSPQRRRTWLRRTRTRRWRR